MYEINNFEKTERKKSKLAGILKIVLFFILVAFTLNILTNSYLDNKSKHGGLFISPLATVKEVIKKTTTYFNSQENSKSLEQIVGKVLKNEKNNYAVVIKNLDTGERYYLNEDKIFDTASIYKLWIMAVAFNMIEDNKLDKSEVLSADVSDLNTKFNIATKSAELTEGNVSWSVEDALEKMITISDNYSALLLSSKIKISNITLFLKNNGFSSSRVGTLENNPKSSAKDTALFFEKLYDGDLANEQYTEEMLTLLKNQQIDTKLSKYLPRNIIFPHKTGELENDSHDGGIVYTSKGNYIIVIMSETNTPLDANENIADISKSVYEYFTK